MSEPENPPAFAAYAENCGQVGMTLRDWFAGQAMSSVVRTFADQPIGNEREAYANIAKLSFGIADAMLAERAKP